MKKIIFLIIFSLLVPFSFLFAEDNINNNSSPIEENETEEGNGEEEENGEEIIDPSYQEGGVPLGIDYPEINGIRPERTSFPFNLYVAYLFNFVLSLLGFLVLFSVVIGGIKYLTSAGNPENLKDARKQIFSALIGSFILLGSWLIISTINPYFLELEELELEKIPFSRPTRPGVIICNEEIDERIFDHDFELSHGIISDFYNKCFYLSGYGSILEEINKIYTVSALNGEKKHGAYLYNIDRKKMQFIYHDSSSNVQSFEPMEERIFYASPISFLDDYSITRKVTLYKYRDGIRNPENPDPLVFELEDDIIKIIDLKNYSWGSSPDDPDNGSNGSPDDPDNGSNGQNKPLQIGSIELSPSGTRVLFVKESDLNWQEGHTVWPISHNWPALIGLEISSWCVDAEGFWGQFLPGVFGKKIPCASHMIIIPQFYFGDKIGEEVDHGECIWTREDADSEWEETENNCAEEYICPPPEEDEGENEATISCVPDDPDNGPSEEENNTEID